MSKEERQKLVADLREFTGLDNEPWLVRVGSDAADEIERLAAEVERLTTIMSGNVRLIEELDDGAIFEISPIPPKS